MPDYITTTTLKIVELLSANPYFAKTIKPGNQLVKLAGIRWPNPPRRAPADFPYFEIDTPRSTIANRNAMKTFSNSRSAIGDVLIEEKVNFGIEFAWDSLDLNKPNQLKAVFLGILLADPTLGISSPLVRVSGQFDWANREEKSATTGNILRLVQRVTFPVNFWFSRAYLQTMVTPT